MLSKAEWEDIHQRALERFEAAGVILTDEEAENLEIADLGLDRFEEVGLTAITYVNNDRYCAKELLLFPHQVLPEHAHPPFDDYPGKQETLRCRSGTVYLYVEGDPVDSPSVTPPFHTEHYTVGHEIVLEPGDQHTLDPDTKHWFAAGAAGAVISEFSSPSFDAKDVFTDPAIERIPDQPY